LAKEREHDRNTDSEYLRTKFCGDYSNLKKEAKTPEWRELHNKLYNMVSSPIRFMVIRSRRMRRWDL
jgi:hypothetical protein